jgi:hypothetical protein
MVLFHYRSSSVFSLGGWTPLLPTGLACPVVLRQPFTLLPYAYGTLTLFRAPSQTLRLRSTTLLTGLQPRPEGRFGLIRFRSPLLAEFSLFFGLLGCFGSPTYLASRRDLAFPKSGFPIRTSPVIASAHDLPELFAVYHVLHRHLTPRHPPCALTSFVQCDTEKRILWLQPHVSRRALPSRLICIYSLVCTC